MKGIAALIIVITVLGFFCANTAIVLSQGSSSFHANFENAKSELEDIYVEIGNLRSLSGNETSEELGIKISDLKRELGIEDTEIEEVKAKIADERNEIGRLKKNLPVVEDYLHNRNLRYGVSASLGLIIGIWVSIFIFSSAWRRRE